jgi:hypothetical protein
MNDAIALAVKDHQEISGSPHRWADLEITHEHAGYTGLRITLKIGPRRPDGTKEIELVTRIYYIRQDGRPTFLTHAHP